MPNNDYVKREDIFPAVTEIAKEIVFGNQDDDKVVDIINSIPAADVEPVRHGRWVYGSDAQFHCSCCDKVPLMEVKCWDETVWKLKEIMASFIKRCPECGAKMEAEPQKEDGDE